MTSFVSEAELEVLLAERKPLPEDWRQRLELRPKQGHSERELDLVGDAGNKFQIRLRQSLSNPFDFSAILCWTPKDSNRLIRLRRYNGRSHSHRNQLEGTIASGFHVHMLTERYQRSGWREDSYAEATDRYASIQGAIECLMADCHVVAPIGDQLDLLENRDV